MSKNGLDTVKKIVLAVLEPFSISFRKNLLLKRVFFYLIAVILLLNLARQKYGLVFNLKLPSVVFLTP